MLPLRLDSIVCVGDLMAFFEMDIFTVVPELGLAHPDAGIPPGIQKALPDHACGSVAFEVDDRDRGRCGDRLPVHSATSCSHFPWLREAQFIIRCRSQDDRFHNDLVLVGGETGGGGGGDLQYVRIFAGDGPSSCQRCGLGLRGADCEGH